MHPGFFCFKRIQRTPFKDCGQKLKARLQPLAHILVTLCAGRELLLQAAGAYAADGAILQMSSVCLLAAVAVDIRWFHWHAELTCPELCGSAPQFIVIIAGGHIGVTDGAVDSAAGYHFFHVLTPFEHSVAKKFIGLEP
jgi:hypothetical protein